MASIIRVEDGLTPVREHRRVETIRYAWAFTSLPSWWHVTQEAADAPWSVSSVCVFHVVLPALSVVATALVGFGKYPVVSRIAAWQALQSFNSRG